jgi:hypothetical protein
MLRTRRPHHESHQHHTPQVRKPQWTKQYGVSVAALLLAATEVPVDPTLPFGRRLLDFLAPVSYSARRCAGPRPPRLAAPHRCGENPVYAAARRRPRCSHRRRRCRTPAREEPPEDPTRLVFVRLIGSCEGDRAGPLSPEVWRYVAVEKSEARLNFYKIDISRDDPARDEYQYLADTEEVLGLGYTLEGEKPSREAARNRVSETTADPLAVIIEAPAQTRLLNVKPTPTDVKHANGQLLYYWHAPGVETPDHHWQHDIAWSGHGPFRWSGAEEAELAWKSDVAVHPGPERSERVFVHPDVVSELIKAHYPRHITAVDRDRAQAQLAMSGLTALIGLGFSAVTLSVNRHDRSSWATFFAAIAVGAWLTTAVLAAAAFGRPQKPFVPDRDVIWRLRTGSASYSPTSGTRPTTCVDG